MQWNKPLKLAEVVAAWPCTVFRGSQAHHLPTWAMRELGRFEPDDRCEAGEETIFTLGIRCDGSTPLAK